MTSRIDFRLLLLSLLASALFAGLGLWRLEIDTDLVRSLPTGDRVVAEGIEILVHHPQHDRIAVDISVTPPDRDVLLECGRLLEARLRDSGLFLQVGSREITGLIAELASQVSASLPVLFSLQELEEQVAPRLEEEWVRQRLERLLADLGGMEGIGQARFAALDPLGLKDLVLARMASLVPAAGRATIQDGFPLSADGRHLLVTARPRSSATDTALAARIERLLDTAARDLSARFRSREIEVILTPVGSYRAALDNERIIRRDVRLALGMATLGIALLLLASFPRPLIGLLSLLPAMAGTATALLVYSLLYPSLSVMVLGFGGALISITVDHGIGYLLFLDRPHDSTGREAAREIRSIGLLAVVTTIGAFLLLACSDFPVFAELGRFTAMGIFFSFLFVHAVFPAIFPRLKAGSHRPLPLQGLADLLHRGGRPGAAAALLLACVMLFFARPQFEVSLQSMNTVSSGTREADQRFTRVWGDFSRQVVLVHTAASVGELQEQNDRLLAAVLREQRQGVLADCFLSSMIFPGRSLAAANLADWHRFWNPDRRERFRSILVRTGERLGFAAGAFSGFLAFLEPGYAMPAPGIPERFHRLLGIRQEADGSGLSQYVSLVPGPRYESEPFFARYGEKYRLFDGDYFGKRLAGLLFSTFARMMFILGGGLAVLLLFFYLSLRLTLVTLVPVVFAYVCTLGTLHLLHRPLDIPALMLSIVILGMGIDYAIFSVRGYQRYRREDHPSLVLVRSAIFLAAGSTLIGFGSLCFAEHSLLQSIGLTSLLGIGYSLLGTFFLLPPLLRASFRGQGAGPRSRDIVTRVRARYRTLEAYPRMFARFKLRFDPMFAELPDLLARRPLAREAVQTIIDIGCGYGVPGCWFLESFPRAILYGIDPDPERVRVAALAAGERGRIVTGKAPGLPETPDPADLVLILDMLHYLDDRTAASLFRNCARRLRPGGMIVARFVRRPGGRPSLSWRLEDFRVKRAGHRAWYRTADQVAELMASAGLRTVYSAISAADTELVWIAAEQESRTGDHGR